MGIRLSIFSVLNIGVLSVGIVVACISTGIFLTLFITRKLGLPERLGTLIGVGTGICGASAIVATGPAIEAEEDEVAYAIGTITIFGIMAMFLYPYLSHLVLSLSHVEAGIFMGTSIHETAQVAAAGIMYDQLWLSQSQGVTLTGADVAIVTKLVRNAFMALAIPFMAYIYVQRNRSTLRKKSAHSFALSGFHPWIHRHGCAQVHGRLFCSEQELIMECGGMEQSLFDSQTMGRIFSCRCYGRDRTRNRY